MRKFWENLAFWRQWDDKERAVAVKITGLCVAAVAVFVLIASVSYLFHWKEDMSLLGNADMMDAGVRVGNAAGKLGYKTGYLLVCNLFGLGSFALLVILAAISARLIAGRWHYSLIKTTLIALTGSFVIAVLLAYVGSLTGLQNAFGGGLGGRMGSQVIAWSDSSFLPANSRNGCTISAARVIQGKAKNRLRRLQFQSPKYRSPSWRRRFLPRPPLPFILLFLKARARLPAMRLPAKSR